jgi:hypothetical protein
VSQADGIRGALTHTEGTWAIGWALFEDAPEVVVEVHLYAGDDRSNGRILGNTRASLELPELEGRPEQGHGFAFRLPAEVQDGRPYVLRAFAINPLGEPNPMLPAPLTVTLPALEPPPPLDPARPVTADRRTEIWVCKSKPSKLIEAPEDWAEAAAGIDVLKLYVDEVNRADVEDLRALVRLLEARGIRTAVELGGLVDWEAKAGDQSGERSFATEFAKLRKLTLPVEEGGAGGRVDYLDVDGPIRRMLYPNNKTNPVHTLETAAAELADCFQLWRREWPHVQFHLLTNFPNYGWAGKPGYFSFGGPDAEQGYGDYAKVLPAVLRVLDDRGIDLRAVTVDNPYDYAIGEAVSNQAWTVRGVDWCQRILALETTCRERGLRFQLIVNSGRAGDRRGGSNERYREETLRYLDLYYEIGGRPDGITIQSWYSYPGEWLPEDREGTMMNLVRDTLRKFPKHALRGGEQ